MSTRRVIVSTPASDDEVRILTYVLDVHGAKAARSLLDRFDRARSRLHRLSERGRVVPELQRRGITAMREIAIPPYRLIYRVVATEVWIVALFDGRRDLTDLLLERARGALRR